MTGAEVIILNIIKDIEEIEHTTVSATTNEGVRNEKEIIVKEDAVTDVSEKERHPYHDGGGSRTANRGKDKSQQRSRSKEPSILQNANR